MSTDQMPDSSQPRWQELPAAALAHTLTFIPHKRSDVKLVCRDWRRAVNESMKSLTLPSTELDVLQHMPAVKHLTVKGLSKDTFPADLRALLAAQPQHSNPWAKTEPGMLQRLHSLSMSNCYEALVDLAGWQQLQQQQAAVARVPSSSRGMSNHGQQANNQDAEGSGPGWRLHMLQSLSLDDMELPVADALSLLLMGQALEGTAHGGGGSAAAVAAAGSHGSRASSSRASRSRAASRRASSSSTELRAAALQHLTSLHLSTCCVARTLTPMPARLQDPTLPCSLADSSALPFLQHLPSLADLSVVDCGLVDVPHSVGGCSGLTGLDLGHNLLSSLPAELSQLQKLQVLDLSYNENLYSLGPGFSSLSSLTELRLSAFNALFKQRRPADGPASTDDTLVDWQVASHEQQLQALPELRHLQALRKLFLGSNRDIRELPTVLSALTGLQVLDVRGCSIRHLGDALWECVGLQQLLLGDNVLAQLPASISKLQDLEVLDVGDCRSLWLLPRELSTLRKLRELKVPSLAADQNLLEQLQLRDPNPVEVVLDTDDEFEDEEDPWQYDDEMEQYSDWDSDIEGYPFG